MTHGTIKIRFRCCQPTALKWGSTACVKAGLETTLGLGNTVLVDRDGHLRNPAQLDVAIDSKQRGGDIVNMRFGGITSGGRIKARAGEA
jgi:hypothetical protein